jgi:hypothetical protein
MDMAEFLLAHLGIPLLAGLVFVFMVAASDTQPLRLSSCNDVALDLVVLSIGANGATFLNPRLSAHWGQFTPVVGILVVLANLLLASVLVYRRRWRRAEPSRAQGYADLFFGALGLSVTAMVFYIGFNGS